MATRAGVCCDVGEESLQRPAASPDDRVRCLRCGTLYTKAAQDAEACPECGHPGWIAATLPLGAAAPVETVARPRG